VASGNSAAATMILWLWHQVIIHNDSMAVASGNSAATTMILWLWHQVIQQHPQ
jgi:hypothetical protein